MHQAVSVNVRIVNVCADGIAALAQVVRGHVGSHTYRDTCGTVQKQERRLGRQNRRLLDRIIEVQLEIDGVLLHITEDIVRQFFEFRLGISHCGNRVTVH